MSKKLTPEEREVANAKRRAYLRSYRRHYRQRPEVKEYQRAYRQRPEVIEKRRAYNQLPVVKAKNRDLSRAYLHRPGVKSRAGQRQRDRRILQRTAQIQQVLKEIQHDLPN